MSGTLLSMLSKSISSYGKSYTLNFDGSHNNQENKSGAGCVIWDSQGEFVVAAAYNLTQAYPYNSNVAIAEAVALLNGLKLAKDHNLNLKRIEGDSTEVINYVLGRTIRPSGPPLSGIIQQIVGMIDRFSQDIVIIDRNVNQVADKLASWGRNNIEEGGHRIYSTYAHLPPLVAELVRQNRSFSSSRREGNGGEGSNTAENIAMVGAAVVGIVMFAWEVSKLFSDESSDESSSDESSSDQQQLNNDHYTLHFDGSDIHQQQKGGAGCIIRNKLGKLVIAAAYNLDDLDQSHVAIAEAIAFRNGLKLAKREGIKLNLIKGDNREVIDRVRDKHKRPARVPFLNEIIAETLKEQSIDPMIQVQLIETADDNNYVADELASMGSKLRAGMEKIYSADDVLPPKLAQFIQQDESKWTG